MRNRVIPFVLLIAAVVAGPARVDAQPRVDAQVRAARERVRERIEAYQGRDRRDQREEQTERISRTLRIGPKGELHIGNIAGNISVVRGGGSDVTIEAIKTSRGRTADEAREMLGLVQVDINERGNRAEVKTRYPEGDEFRRNNRRNINVSVAFTVTAPVDTRVSISSISGDIITKDIKGDVALESVSGSVRIANGGRAAAAKSISGDVEVTDTEVEGRLEVSSVSGNTLLRHVRARAVEAAAVSGNVIVDDVTCDRIEAQTVSGDVQFSGPLARGGRYELSSHSGSVQVNVAGNTGFELEATSFSGSVRSDITLTSQSSDGSRRHNRTVRGVYGDGSAVLDVTTFSGSIVISRR